MKESTLRLFKEIHELFPYDDLYIKFFLNETGHVAYKGSRDRTLVLTDFRNDKDLEDFIIWIKEGRKRIAEGRGTLMWEWF